MVTPLNWGLGHATRDIPIIKLLLEKGAEVVIAGDGPALQLLITEFPQLPSYELPGWNITYPKSGSFVWHMLKQAGKILWAITAEHKAVEAIVEKEKIDVVISDNRLGAYSKKAKCIVISHQLFLESPIIKRFLNWNNARLIKKFEEVWIADFPGENNLSGSLSHRATIPFSHRYLGVISRFEKIDNDIDSRLEILAIISGPEPQRTLFEQELIPEMKKLNKPAVVLLGKPGLSVEPVQDGNLTIYNHLPGEQLARLFSAAQLVVSRDGYTTVMDLAVLGKKAILVPTPGQTEQEYLANYYQQKGWYVIQYQGKINLELALEQIPNSAIPIVPAKNFLNEAVESLFEAHR